MDRAYVHYERLYSIHLKKAFFVVRAKNNLKLTRISSRNVNKELNVICDFNPAFRITTSCKKIFSKLEENQKYDLEFTKTLVFLTKNKRLKAETITTLAGPEIGKKEGHY